MLVLNAHRPIAVIPLLPQQVDIPSAEHVAVHEQRPALVTHQMGHQKTCKGEGCALLRITFTAIQPLGF